MEHYYRTPGDAKPGLLAKIAEAGLPIQSVESEYCLNVAVTKEGSLPRDERDKLLWLFTETYAVDKTRGKTSGGSFLTERLAELQRESASTTHACVVEVGPRLAFSTAWSSNCVSMCEACGIHSVSRIERSRRYLLVSSSPLSEEDKTLFASLVHDRMTECVYKTPLETFESDAVAASVTTIPILEQGSAALKALNEDKGLGFDDWDIEFYTKMFTETLKRNPTDVECFDLGQSNSEHSRHWFFGGKMVLDGVEQKDTLFSMVKATLPEESNSVIAFHDNSSAIRGFEVPTLAPTDVSQASSMQPRTVTLHPILTAETHNFPTGVAPFAGAETGTGGRLRDVQATGRGANTVAGISAYCVGNLNIPGYTLPWEPAVPEVAANLAKPLAIQIEASNGASDYGNKYGEPVVAGFSRSFGQRLPSGERYEWLKPIMFTAGIGSLNDLHSSKGEPEVGMVVCKIGGPAYRIGMGGGAASSRLQGTADAALDFNAVQRGDAEMENRMNRVIRACVELGEDNPIVSIHDQGAGGNGNVLKELVDPLGAVYELRNIPVGDPTLSALEIWGAEYQENNAFLVRAEDLAKLLALSRRENCPVSPVGTVTGDGRVTVVDSKQPDSAPFDLPLSLVLGKMPQKTFSFNTSPSVLLPLELPPALSVASALDRVLRLLDVGSKRFLTNKVDRSVSGLVAQQQCVGPLHTPLADVAVVALSHFSTKGTASAVGEQPIKGLISPAAQARMTVGEALTNLVFARITNLADVKASGNWMWAAKLPGEGKKMWDACVALRDCLLALGPGIDGGKDSLSMAAKVGSETVKSPGQLTLTCYAACPDITLTVTPDLKLPGQSTLLLVDLCPGKARLGGSALSTVFGQLGDESPDLEDCALFKRAFDATQRLLDLRLIRAGHDRSDGGIVVTALEMAFAGNCGFELSVPPAPSPSASKGQESNEHAAIRALFSEELGLLLEVADKDVDAVLAAYSTASVPCVAVGRTQAKRIVSVSVGGVLVLPETDMPILRDAWEATSFALERLQCNPACVESERALLKTRPGPAYSLSFRPTPTEPALLSAPASSKFKVAVVRQEGSNGDREMISALYLAGFDPWDVNMNDLLAGQVDLQAFRGIVFVGGFSYADVNDSAKGWAGVIRFNAELRERLEAFRTRPDTFSLGICNGCQLLALLGWVPFPTTQPTAQGGSGSVPEQEQPRLVHNESGRFESRWSTVLVQRSPSVLLKGMEGSSLGVWVAHGEGRCVHPIILSSSSLSLFLLLTSLTRPPSLSLPFFSVPQRLLPQPRLARPGRRAGACPAPLRRRRQHPHRAVSLQPQRLSPRHRRPVQRRRQAPGPYAAPRAVCAAVAVPAPP